MLKNSLFSLLMLFAVTARAEEIVLVKDVNANPRHLNISGNCRAGAKEFLIADDGIRGQELWLGNGLAGTKLIKEIRSGTADGVLSSTCFPINDQTILFVANDPVTGVEVWRSDGTAAGTVIVKDIAAGTDGSNPGNFFLFGSTVLFSAIDSTGTELWKTDGTEAGTVRLKEINPGVVSGIPANFVKLNDSLVLFTATTAAEGRELWKTDGTEAGTALVKDIRSGASGSNPGNLTAVNNLVLFYANDGAVGNELYKSDGTPGGTELVKDIYTGATAGVSTSSRFQVLGNKILFSASTAATGFELFESDGTTGGTNLFKEFFAGATGGSPSAFMPLNNKLFFIAQTAAAGSEPWVTDGTLAGTEQLADIVPGAERGATSPVAYANEAKTLVAFEGYPQAQGSTALWSTDGTVSGTQELASLFPGSNDYLEVDSDPTSAGLTFGLPAPVSSVPQGGAFLTDGTLGGTRVHPGALSGFTESSVPVAMGVINSKLIFTADNAVNGYELWSTDGTEAGTALIKDINPGAASSVVPDAGFAVLGSKLIFVAATPDEGTELWVTDGTSAGTVLLKDIEPGQESAFDSNSSNGKFHTLGSLTLFAARTNAAGLELWKTDGTSGGTAMIEDINPGVSSSISDGLEGLVADGPAVFFFAANDGTNGAELWVSDGTAMNTLMLANIAPAGASSSPRGFAKNPSPGNGVAFQACTATQGCEPWFTTGFSTGIIEDIVAGTGSSNPQNFQFVTADKLFFTATTAASGEELWFSQGSAVTTDVVKEIGAGATGSSPRSITPFNASTVLFSACSDDFSDCELWRSDGTSGGTNLVRDIAPGLLSSGPSGITMLNGIAYFLGSSGIDGEGARFFRSDGTEAGTTVLTSQGEAYISPDDLPSVFTSALGTLFLAAYHTAYGYELFKIGDDQCPDDPLKSIPGVCGCGSTDTDDDGDGTINCQETCPADQEKSAPGVCGCGVADTDSNSNGVVNCIEDALTATVPPAPKIAIKKNKKTQRKKITVTMTAKDGSQYELFTAVQKKRTGKKKPKAPKYKSKIFTTNTATVKTPPAGSKLFVKYRYLLSGTSVASQESPAASKKIK